jgi:hypothetical protein
MAVSHALCAATMHDIFNQVAKLVSGCLGSYCDRNAHLRQHLGEESKLTACNAPALQ